MLPPAVPRTYACAAARHPVVRHLLFTAAIVTSLVALRARAQVPADTARSADTSAIHVAANLSAGAVPSAADSGRVNQPVLHSRAAGHLDAAVALRGGTLGAGVEIGKLVSDHFAVRAGYFHTPLGMNRTVSGVNYDARVQLQGATLLADLFPSARGRFHISAGAVVNGPRITASALPGSDGTITLNGHPYTRAEFGRLTGTLSTRSLAPYFGVGLGTPARKSAISLVTDMGVMVGSPTLTLDASGATTSLALRSDLDAQQAKTQQQINRYGRVIPVSSIGLTVRF